MIRSLAMLCIGAAALLAGCIQVAPVPNFARSGDTLILGLGGIQRNAQGNQLLATSDLQITLTDSANVTYTLTPQQPFKAFPDYNSNMNYQTIKGGTTMAPLPIQVFDGGWFVPVSLTSGLTTPIAGLAVGPATISIASPTGKLVSIQSVGNFGSSQGIVHEGDPAGIPIEILPGTVAVDTDYQNQFKAYSPFQVPGFNVAPSSLNGLTEVGGMQVAIKYNSSYYTSPHLPLVLPYSHNPSINLQQNIVDNGDGTKTINVLLTAPKGFSSSPTHLKPSLRDLNIRVMNFGGTNASINWQIQSSKFIDMSGNVIPELTAVRGQLVL